MMLPCLCVCVSLRVCACFYTVVKEEEVWGGGVKASRCQWCWKQELQDELQDGGLEGVAGGGGGALDEKPQHPARRPPAAHPPS